MAMAATITRTRSDVGEVNLAVGMLGGYFAGVSLIGKRV